MAGEVIEIGLEQEINQDYLNTAVQKPCLSPTQPDRKGRHYRRKDLREMKREKTSNPNLF